MLVAGRASLNRRFCALGMLRDRGVTRAAVTGPWRGVVVRPVAAQALTRAMYGNGGRLTLRFEMATAAFSRRVRRVWRWRSKAGVARLRRPVRLRLQLRLRAREAGQHRAIALSGSARKGVTRRAVCYLRPSVGRRKTVTNPGFALVTRRAALQRSPPDDVAGQLVTGITRDMLRRHVQAMSRERARLLPGFLHGHASWRRSGLAAGASGGNCRCQYEHQRQQRKPSWAHSISTIS